MTEESFTIIDEGRAAAVRARTAGSRVRLSPEALETALGWQLKPQGLCRGAVCVPVPPGAALVTAEGVDLGELASLLGRPLAVDPVERAAFLGASPRDRGAALGSLEAPDFTLPDLAGRRHRLSDHRGKKVLLVAWASW